MIIETERLILRPFLESDAEDVYEYLHEPAVNCFVEDEIDNIEEETEEEEAKEDENTEGSEDNQNGPTN